MIFDRSAEGCVIEDSQVLVNCPARRFGRKSLLTFYTPPPVGIRSNQASVDFRGFSAIQTFSDGSAALHLEEAA
jgi:hypothetical protein